MIGAISGDNGNILKTGIAIMVIGLNGVFCFWLLMKIQVKGCAWYWSGKGNEFEGLRMNGIAYDYFKNSSSKTRFQTLMSRTKLNQYLPKASKWHHKRLVKCGMASHIATQCVNLWRISLVGLPTVYWILNRDQLGKSFLIAIAMEIFFWTVTQTKIKQRQNTFVTGVYKIYRYMALQLTAGLSCVEVIKYLHESVEEPFLKEAMFGFSSCYFKTMEIDLAVEELINRIEGDEIQVLGTVLRQGLQTGNHYEMVVKQEQLMVKRYYAAIASESQQVQNKGILLAIALCMLVFTLLAAPMLYEMARASQTIFIGQ